MFYKANKSNFEAYNETKKIAEGLPNDLYRWLKAEDVGDIQKAIEIIQNGQTEWFVVTETNPNDPDEIIFNTGEVLDAQTISENSFTTISDENFITLLKNDWVE